MSDASSTPPGLPPEPPSAAPPFTPPPPSTPPPGAAPPPPTGGAVSPNRTPMLVLAYLWVLSLVPFLVEKDDPEVQWHAKHGLVLLVAEILLWVVINIVNSILGMIIGPFACIGCLPLVALGIGAIVLRVMLILKALKGERLLIPGVSHYADQF